MGEASIWISNRGTRRIGKHLDVAESVTLMWSLPEDASQTARNSTARSSVTQNETILVTITPMLCSRQPGKRLVSVTVACSEVAHTAVGLAVKLAL